MPRSSRQDIADNVAVLMYHDVASTLASRAFRRFVVPPTLFAEHLLALREAGYATAHISQLGDPRAAGPLVFLTFDDGFATIVENALPVLAEQGMTATLFLPTAFIGGRAAWLSGTGEACRPLLAWQDVRGAATAGFEIGSHGHRHLELDVIPKESLEQELSVSKGLLEDQTSTAVQSLAYPFGYHDRHVRAATVRAGYRAACEVGYGLHRVSRDPLRIRRLLIGPDLSGDGLLRLMTDGTPTVDQRARRATRRVWRLARRARAAVEASRSPHRTMPRPSP